MPARPTDEQKPSMAPSSSDFDEPTQVGQFDSARLKLTRDRDRAYIIVLAGENIGQMFRLDQTETVIGRSAGVTIRLQDEGVSRKHAKIVQGDGEPWIQDLQSANGTIINGERVGRAVLRDGDKIRVGSAVVLKFTYADALDENFQQKMYDAALRDGLTKAYNQRHFLERLPTETAHARRHGVALSLLMLDIDHFKRVNDTFGHPAGDYVLATLAGVILAGLRAEDLFARYGGEEFCVLCLGTTLENATALAHRIRRTVETSVFLYGVQRIPITVSIGVATWSQGTDAGEQLTADADAALYEAKARGRNLVVAQRPSQ
ncbi:MAG: GGDEF domain-containing protein [Myxococcota bacterium]|nr:GGDEF domain-containing protein [Myxococcota bacterium]